MFSSLRLRHYFGHWLRQQGGESAWLGLILLAAVVAISPNVADPDLWGHVQYGREMWREGLATHTTHSYLAASEPWINHEILAELLLAAIADFGGATGLLLAKMLGGATLLLVILLAMRREKLSLLSSAIILLATATGLARYWSLRPQLLSFLAYAALLALLSWVFVDWEHRWQLRWRKIEITDSKIAYCSSRMRWLWWVPILMGLWTNAHGGFLAGECLYSAYLVLRGCELFSQRGWEALGLLKRFTLMIGVAWLATFFNPYGYKFHAWLWSDLAVPRPEIIEWLPPDFTQPQAWPLLVLIGIFVMCIVGSRLPHDFTHCGILGLTLWQAISHERHIPFFAISCAFFLPRHVENVLQRCGAIRGASVENARPNENRGGVLAFATLFLLAFSCVGYKLYDRLHMLQVPCNEYPVSAVRFMAQHALRGRIVCTMNWAQYVLAAFPESLDVQIDGRLRTAYSQKMIDTHFDFLYGEQPPTARFRGDTPFHAVHALEEKYPNLVLLHRGQSHAVGIMEQQCEWVLLYQDGLAQLWGRSTRYDNAHSSDYLAPELRNIHNEPPTGIVAWPAFPTQ